MNIDELVESNGVLISIDGVGSSGREGNYLQGRLAGSSRRFGKRFLWGKLGRTSAKFLSNFCLLSSLE
jgi:hypothetical protein